MMFKLVIRPDGKAMLTTEKYLQAAELEHVRKLFDIWMNDAEHRTLIMGGTKVVQVVDFELDVDNDRAPSEL